MASLRALLIDLDGVVYEDDRLVPGALEALSRLREESVPHLFVTNTSSKARGELATKLANFGVAADEEQIITPTAAAAEWIIREGHEPAALFLQSSARRDFAGVRSLPFDAEVGAGSVVIGDLCSAWTFAELNRAFRLLMDNPRAPLVALGRTRYWLASDGLRLDVGPFVAALEEASGRAAVVLGKPAPEFFGIALQQLGISAEEAAMVGDDIHTDVGAALRIGMKGVLVRTGKFRNSDLETPVSPDAVLKSIAELPHWWRMHNSYPRPGQRSRFP